MIQDNEILVKAEQEIVQLFSLHLGNKFFSNNTELVILKNSTAYNIGFTVTRGLKNAKI